MKKITLTLCIFHLALCISYAQSGTLDNTFGSGGKVTTSFGGNQGDEGKSVVIQNDGKIIVAGTAYSGSPTYGDFALVRYNTDGSLDNTFGTGGKVTTDFGTGTAGDAGFSVALQSDGKIVVTGAKSVYSGNTDFALARYNNNGSLDNTFGTGGKVTIDFGGYADLGLSVAIQSDGKIVIAGVTSNSSTSNDVGLVRYNSNGSLDNTFGTGGIVTTTIGSTGSRGNAVTIQSDGKIVVAGAINGTSDSFALVRYNSNGSLDNTFGTGGIVSTNIGSSNGYAVTIQSDGKIVVAGSGNNSSDFALARYNTNGSLDNTFGSSGIVTTSAFLNNYNYGRSVVIQSDGKIILAGSTCPSAAPCDITLIRYNTNGSLDNSFGSGGIVTTDFGMSENGNSIALQSDGKIVVAGSSGQQYYGLFALARYNNTVLSGVAESSNDNLLKVEVYPNPSSGIFTVNFKNKIVETEICIRDILGNCVLNKVSVKNINPEIDLSSQPKGVYFMEIISESEKAVKKIVLQ